ncbi:MAG: hypothetical protein K6E63_06315 [Lachnospiraceae bacterium]|nr:hypothetical protein [Lachnospiraceae bacterium]
MEQELLNDKQLSARKFSRLAMIFGVISLAGLICCFPLMPIAGALGIMFAILSRGREEMSKEARQGLIYSVIGTTVSLLLTVGIMVFSVYYTLNELKTNDKIVDEVREQYEQMFDNAGMDVPPEIEDALDKMEEYSKKLREGK